MDTWKMVKMREMSVLAIVLAFHVICVLSSEYCNRPSSPSVPSSRIAQHCPGDMCAQHEAQETCHCEKIWQDNEAPGHPSSKSLVKLYGLMKLCWEKEYEDSNTRFYGECYADSDPECRFEHKIEICYREDIDAAQAMCRQFNKGDAFDSAASTSRRRLRRRNSSGQRNLLAYLNCPIHPSGINSCRLEYLDESVAECDQMVAHCFWTGCFQEIHSVRARSMYGDVSGKIRYGQKCKNDTSGAHGVCTKECFRCPSTWKGSEWDGLGCFGAHGGNTQEGTLIWEPHFRTMDGKHFDFQGQCSYFLMKHGSFSIVAKFTICGTKGVTCASEITVTSGSTVIRLGQGDDVSIIYRGRNMRATKPFHNDNINYYLASSEFDAVDIWSGYKLLWDRKAEYKVVVPPWNSDSVQGMLGNMNGNPDDDMVKPNGELESDPVKFGDSWMVPGSCPPGVSPRAPENPQLTSNEKRMAHNRGCKYINHNGQNPNSWANPFKNCSSDKHRPEKLAEYNNCLMDVATCNRDLNSCLCPSFTFLADYCEKNEEGVGDWRKQMPGSLCNLHCNQTRKEEFRMNADPCSQTCDAIKYIKEKKFDCIKMKVEGCNCPDGMARNATKHCIKIDDCPP